MNEYRFISYMLVMIFKGLIFFFIIYLLSLKMDIFYWGDQTNDGLYLIIIPMYLFPLILILSFIKWLLLRKINLPFYIRGSQILYIFICMVIIVIISLSILDSLISIFLSAFAGILALIEPIIVFRIKNEGKPE